MLRARVITALLLVAGLAVVLFAVPPWAVVLVFAVVAALAAWEWAGLMGQAESQRRSYGVIVFFACGVVHLFGNVLLPVFFVASAMFWCLTVPYWLNRRWSLKDSRLGASAVGILVILPTWAAMVALQAISSWLLLAAMALVWVADIAAYFAGRAFGKRKLAPQISPGKTWEGVAGAVVGVIAYGLCVVQLTPLAARVPLGVPALLALLIVLTALSVIGDLYESMLKRQAAIKDSSHLLPGHGGVLDRIDSLTSTLPVLALLSLLWQS